MGYIKKTPMPDPKTNPQFRISYEKAEVNPPTKEQVEKILNTATGQVRFLCQLMRETALALVDAIKYAMSQQDAEKYEMSKPERCPVIQKMVIRGNRTKTNQRYRVRISESLAKQLEALGEPAFPGTYQRLMNRIVRQGVRTKVLMLSATPVNNRFNDLKNQLALAYEGEPENLKSKLSTERNIDLIFRRAQTAFNVWSKLPAEQRTPAAILSSLDFDFFELLDAVTIARSRSRSVWQRTS
jgi:hypothetical protein